MASERISTDNIPDSLRDAARRAEQLGTLCLSQLIRALEFGRDGNRIRNLTGKAERWCLAMAAHQRAVAEAERFGMPAFVELARDAEQQFAAQFPTLVSQAISAYHAQRVATLRASKSGQRQLATARKSLRELDRLAQYPLPPEAAARYAIAVQYWRDQESLSVKHEND